MKKIILAFSLALALILTACGSDKKTMKVIFQKALLKIIR